MAADEAFSFNDIYGIDKLKLREWEVNGLPPDRFSVMNALIMEKSSRFSICIDPQLQATKWLRRQHKERGIIVTKYSDLTF